MRRMRKGFFIKKIPAIRNPPDSESSTRINKMRVLGNEKGIALITVYVASIMITALSLTGYSRAFFEMRNVDREITRTRAFAAAEAGLQSAMAQIGVIPYTGYIKIDPINITPLKSVSGGDIGNVAVNLFYPDQADWVTVQSTATVDGETRNLEGRVFLNSNLSKYLLYSVTPDLNLGTNLVFGAPDGVNPRNVPANDKDRTATYHTGDLNFNGSNIRIYADVHAKNYIVGEPSSNVYGDTYSGKYSVDALGKITSGVTNNLIVGDGFEDDSDRNHDGVMDDKDKRDQHALTADGAGDSHAEETLTPIDNNFYTNHNADPAKSRGYGNAKTRYLKFQASADGTQTVVYEYSSASLSKLTDTFTLPVNSILYVNGSIYCRGEIAGRVSVVSSSDIFFDGDVKYAGGNSYVTPQNSAAFLAKDRVYFRPFSVEVSGIVYAERSTGGTNPAIDGRYTTSGSLNPDSKYDGHLRLFGNLILNGTGSTDCYRQDRAYVYDPKLKYYRPPGIPISPELRIVREE